MKYEFKCKICKQETLIECPSSEYYIPDCKLCDKPMQRYYYKPNVISGCLNGGNIA